MKSLQAKKELEYQDLQNSQRHDLVGSKIVSIGLVSNDTIHIKTENGSIVLKAKGRKSNYLVPEYNINEEK